MQMKLFLLLFIILFITINLSSSIDLPSAALPSSSGYLTVNQTSGSSIFYTYYEAQRLISSLHKTPLVIWLQGGPGCSSMIGNFYELGPWRIVPCQGTVKLEQNPGSWNRLFGLLFLDNPIGSGFSIAASSDEIPRDQYQVAKHLFAAIRAFIRINPGFGSRSVYITGESYAGKYVPAIGYYILNKNPELDYDERVNLAGLAIGDGLTDPRTQVMTYADQGYYLGLINEKQRTQLELAQREAVRLVDRGLWVEATNARNHVLHMLQNMTGLATLYDLRRKIPYQDDLVGELLNNAGVKAVLGASPSIVWDSCNDVVGDALHADVMKSVRFMVDDILLKSATKLLLYQGQCDLRDSVVSVEAWMKKLMWDGIDEFLDAERKVWKVNGELAGYVQKSRGLSHVVVLDAGHLVPTDQAVHSQAMIEDWILERGLFVEEESLHDGRTSPRTAL
ncbi:Serine carboxypeptidase-like 50-like protein [Drosera capensis]